MDIKYSLKKHSDIAGRFTRACNLNHCLYVGKCTRTMHSAVSKIFAGNLLKSRLSRVYSRMLISPIMPIIFLYIDCKISRVVIVHNIMLEIAKRFPQTIRYYWFIGLSVAFGRKTHCVRPTTLFGLGYRICILPGGRYFCRVVL